MEHLSVGRRASGACSPPAFLPCKTKLPRRTRFCHNQQVSFCLNALPAPCCQTCRKPKRVLTGWGIFYGGNGNQLGVQVLAIVTILVWSLSINFMVFGVLKRLNCLRVSEKVELDGLDHSQAIGSGVVFGCACLT